MLAQCWVGDHFNKTALFRGEFGGRCPLSRDFGRQCEILFQSLATEGIGRRLLQFQAVGRSAGHRGRIVGGRVNWDRGIPVREWWGIDYWPVDGGRWESLPLGAACEV